MTAIIGRNKLSIELPDGWSRIMDGKPEQGDKYLDMGKIPDGLIRWIAVNQEDFEQNWLASEYDCLIRKM